MSEQEYKKVLIIGAAGFIGTNLAYSLLEKGYALTLADCHLEFLDEKLRNNENIECVEIKFNHNFDFESILKNQDLIFHLISTTVPTTSNQHISQELSNNVITTTKLLEACKNVDVKRVVFISSGGTVYGIDGESPHSETDSTYPITAYGLQKITIEKLLYLFKRMYGLDYKIIRLSNPYGPYQRPNGVLGAVTTFTYKIMNENEITIYGDGSVIRDYIYIADAIEGIENVAFDHSEYQVFNLGSGIGTSLIEVVKHIENTLGKRANIKYEVSRNVDVPTNYLNVSRYSSLYGNPNKTRLNEGIKLTSEFLKSQYGGSE